MVTSNRNKEIINLYQSGKSAKEISELYDLHPTWICRILKKNGIIVEKGGAKRRRKHINSEINHDFFKEITERSAYYLGFIYADGNIYKKSDKHSWRVTLEIKDSDIEILENFSIGNKINYNPKKNSVYMSITSNEIAEDLMKYGITSKKTKSCVFPTNIPDEFIHHFIRGYFDGDGGFGIYTKYNRLVAYICGTKPFLEKLGSYLPCKYTIRDTKNGIYEIRISTTSLEMGKFVSFLYRDCNIFLTRKRQKSSSHFN